MTDDPARTHLLLDIAVPPHRIHVLDALADRTVDMVFPARP